MEGGRIDLLGSEQGPLVSICEHGNGTAGSLSGWKIGNGLSQKFANCGPMTHRGGGRRQALFEAGRDVNSRAPKIHTTSQQLKLHKPELPQLYSAIFIAMNRI
jgi:hypothetical protein